MIPRIALLVCLLAVLSTVVVADTISSSYDAGTDKWNYDVTFSPNGQSFRVYLDPNMSWNYITGIGFSVNSGTWSNPGSLGTDYSWSGITLPYLEWAKSFGTTTSGSFWFSDAHYMVDGVHEMDLNNHPGPLLYNPPSHRDAPAAQTTGTGDGATWYGYDGIDTAITPEPTTLSLLALGLLGLAGVVRRRRSM